MPNNLRCIMKWCNEVDLWGLFTPAGASLLRSQPTPWYSEQVGPIPQLNMTRWCPCSCQVKSSPLMHFSRQSCTQL